MNPTRTPNVQRQPRSKYPTKDNAAHAYGLRSRQSHSPAASSRTPVVSKQTVGRAEQATSLDISQHSSQSTLNRGSDESFSPRDEPNHEGPSSPNHPIPVPQPIVFATKSDLLELKNEMKGFMQMFEQMLERGSTTPAIPDRAPGPPSAQSPVRTTTRMGPQDNISIHFKMEKSVNSIKEFDGTGDLEAWIEKLRYVGEYYDWPQSTFKYAISTKVCGIAETFLRSRRNDIKNSSVEEIFEMLRDRFCPANKRELFRNEFRRALPTSGQDLCSFLDALRVLVERGFPRSTKRMQEEHVRARFLQVLEEQRNPMYCEIRRTWAMTNEDDLQDVPLDDLYRMVRPFDDQDRYLAMRDKPAEVGHDGRPNPTSTPLPHTNQWKTGVPRQNASGPQRSIANQVPMEPNRSRATASRCYNCNMPGHFAANCSNRRKVNGSTHTVTQVEFTGPDEQDCYANVNDFEEEFLLAESACEADTSDCHNLAVQAVQADVLQASTMFAGIPRHLVCNSYIYIDVKLFGRPLKVILDTASHASMLSVSMYKELKKFHPAILYSFRKVPVSVNGYGQQPIRASHMVEIAIDCPLGSFNHPVIISSHKAEPLLLGTNFLQQIAPCDLKSWPGRVSEVIAALNPALSSSSAKQCADNSPPIANRQTDSDPQTGSAYITTNLSRKHVHQVLVQAPVPSGLYFVEGLPSCQNVAVLPGLAEVSNQGHATVLIANASSRKKKIKKNDEIAVFHRVAVSQLTSIPAESHKSAGEMLRPQDRIQWSAHGDDRQQLLRKQLKISKDILTNEEQEALERVILQHPYAFSVAPTELGCTDLMEFDIETTTEEPIAQPPRRKPFFQQQIEAEEVLKMLTLGIVKPSTSPFSSPTLIVKKKNGDNRLCLDYRLLNSVTVPNKMPIPRIDDLTDRLHNRKYKSFLDMKSAYWQMLVSERAQRKMAFTTHHGHWEPQRMMFGVMDAPAYFAEFGRRLTHGCSDMLQYFDDIACASKTFSEHLHALDAFLGFCEDHGVLFGLSKCAFCPKEYNYLGHAVQLNKTRPDEEKVSAITQFPVPRNIQELRRFLGMCNHFCKYVENYSVTASPLFNLTRKGVPFEWSQECEDAFVQLKCALSSRPVLTCPDFSREFQLWTDASSKGVGAVLMQSNEDGEIHPIAYASKALSKHEKNYSPTQLEALGLVWSCQHFRPYLWGPVNNKIYTDHSALTALQIDPSGRGAGREGKLSPTLARWALALQDLLPMTIHHKPGQSNIIADALSRARPDEDEEGESYDPLEKLTCAAVDVTVIPSNLSQKSFAALQRSDASLGKVIEALQSKDRVTGIQGSGDLSKFYLDLKSNLLYRVDHIPRTILRLCVPQSTTAQLVAEFHDGRFGGHFGPRKSIFTLSKFYWWPTMTHDVQRHCMQCDHCARRKPAHVTYRQPLSPVAVPSKPFDLVGMDVIKMPKTQDSYRYLCVFVDYLTDYPIAVPLTDATAVSVAKALVEHVFCLYGCVKDLISDRGANFTSCVFTEACRLLGTRQIFAAAYHPQTNGRCERMVRKILEILSPAGAKWKEVLPYKLMALRSAASTVVGDSPNYLLFGRNLTTPSLFRSKYGLTESESDNPFLLDLASQLSGIWQETQEKVNKHLAKTKIQFDLHRARPASLSVGDKVMLRKGQIADGNKLKDKYEGPFEVVRLLPTGSPKNAVIKATGHADRPDQTVSIDRLKKVSGQLRPCIFKDPTVADPASNEIPNVPLPAHDPLIRGRKGQFGSLNSTCLSRPSSQGVESKDSA